MSQELKHQLQSQSRKINYLLSKINTNTSELPFTNQEIKQLKNIINLFTNLNEEGITQEELFEQLRYLSDINTFKEIQAELSKQYNQLQNGVHANLYSFTFTNYSEFRDLVHNSESTAIPNNVENLFQEGYLICQCLPNLMLATGTNILLDVSSQTSSLRLKLEDHSIECIIAQDTYPDIVLQSSVDQLVSTQTRYVQDKQFYVIKYHYVSGTELALELLYIVIDLNFKNVAVRSSASVIIHQLNFEMLIQNLPPRITNLSIGSPSRSNNEFITVENLFILRRLQTFEANLYDSFTTEFSNSNANSLYGQSAAVGISQLYQTFGSTIRYLSAEYILETPTTSYNGIDIPEHFNIFEVQDKNKFDILGNSFPIVYAEDYYVKPPVDWNLRWYCGFRLRRDDYPTFNLLNEIGNQYVTGNTNATLRANLPKSKIKQVLPDGTINYLDCWIEAITTDSNIVGSPVKGSWAKVDDTILDAQLDADFNNNDIGGIGMKISIDGFQVSVHDPDQLLYERNDCKILHGYKHTHNVTSQVRFIINVSNTSQEGDVQQTISLQLLIDGELRTITTPINKQKIAYGTGEIMAYVAVVDTVTQDVTYFTGTVFTTNFATSTECLYYANRNINNVPINPFNHSYRQSMLKYTGEDEFFQVAVQDGVYYVQFETHPVYDPPITYNFRRGLMIGAADYASPLVASVVPFLQPIISHSDNAYYISIPHLSLAYISLVNTPRVSNFTVNANSNIVLEATVSRVPDTVNQFIPVKYYDGDITSIDSFVEYNNLSMTDVTFNSVHETWIQKTSPALPQYVVQTFTASVDDLFLPNVTLNQITLSETIVELQTAVQFLKYYATYLETLINNLEQRVVYVEESLSQIIDYINLLNQQSQSSLGFAGNLISFLGTGIGMFFPLIGLGVSLIGGILTSADKIEQGDVIMGSIDLTVGGIMATLGLYKYSKRIKNKYGQAEMPQQPILNSSEIRIKPGYIIINNDPPPMYSSGRRKNGVFRNTNLSISDTTGATTTTLTTRLTRQTTLWDQIEWTENPLYQKPRSIALQGIYRETIEESEVRTNTVTSEYYYAMVRTNFDGTIDERVIQQSEFNSLIDVDSTPEDYVKLELLYSQINHAFNSNIGMDDETNVCLLSSNGYQPITNINTINRKNNTLPKWKIIYTKEFSTSRTNKVLSEYGPKIGIETLYEAMNPYRQLESSQVTLYQNCISEVELVTSPL